MKVTMVHVDHLQDENEQIDTNKQKTQQIRFVKFKRRILF